MVGPRVWLGNQMGERRGGNRLNHSFQHGQHQCCAVYLPQNTAPNDESYVKVRWVNHWAAVLDDLDTTGKRVLARRAKPNAKPTTSRDDVFLFR